MIPVIGDLGVTVLVVVIGLYFIGKWTAFASKMLRGSWFQKVALIALAVILAALLGP